MTSELTATIAAVWPAVAMCPVVQNEIAKISAVPISRHVTAFAIAFRIGTLSSVFPLARASAGPSQAVRRALSGVIVLN